MNWFGGGFIQIINYAAGANAVDESYQLLTENNLDLLTELSIEILTEASP